MSNYLYRLASFAYGHRRLALGLWLAVAIAAVAIATASGGKTNDTFSIPGTESQNAAAVLTAKLPAFSGGQTTIVFATGTAAGAVTSTGTGTAKVTDAADKAAIESAMASLKPIPQVSAVTTPFQSNLIAKNGEIALGTVQWSAPATSVTDANLNAVKAALEPLQAKGVEVQYNGSVYPGWQFTISETPELIGIVIAFLILMITFGAFAAADMPILGAITTLMGAGPGFNGALLIVAQDVHSPAATSQITTALTKLPDVVTVTPVTTSNGVSLIKLIPDSGPNDPATVTLVNTIRGDRAAIEGSTGTHLLVGGTTASNIDVSAKLSSALPIFLLVVVGLAFILLTFAFRTILVPLKSILGFLLSMSAALGAQVALFQWGWAQHILGITPTETISFLPIIMLAIIFGLSSDYEVFVVSRIKEEHTLHGDARRAVARGTGHSARVVTAAALIMFSIFVAFTFTSNPTKAQMRETNPMKRFGRPEEVARAAVFLAFEATFTTGAELTVDGGASQL